MYFWSRGLWHYYDIIRTSKTCFNVLNSKQSDENACNRCFLQILLRQYFQSELITFWSHIIANEGLWRHQTLKTHFCGLRPRPGDEYFFMRNCKSNCFDKKKLIILWRHTRRNDSIIIKNWVLYLFLTFYLFFSCN